MILNESSAQKLELESLYHNKLKIRTDGQVYL